ncbi:MAG: hypothetical protein AAF518_09775 [Spirochaetota bacterium]
MNYRNFIAALFLLILASCSNKLPNPNDVKILQDDQKKPLVIPQNASNDYKTKPSFAKAFDLIQKMETLQKSFDLKYIDFYAQNAYIQNSRKYPDGRVRIMQISPQYLRKLAKESIDTIKDRKDYSSYSDLVFASEGKHVRVAAKRFSNFKKYTSPISWLIGLDKASQKWQILEEISESKPF